MIARYELRLLAGFELCDEVKVITFRQMHESIKIKLTVSYN